MIVAWVYDIGYVILAKKLNITYIYDFYLTVITVGVENNDTLYALTF